MRGGLNDWPEYHHTQFEFGDSPVSIARISQLGVPGFCVYMERARASAVVSALSDAGAAEVPDEAIAAARIEAGYPVFGLDMTEDTIPLEAGIESRAISFTKGCYVGQEVIIRVLHRGHGRVARKLVSVRVQGERPDRGARFYSGEREVGAVTSAAESPRSGTIALGYVHRDFLAPGTELEVETALGPIAGGGRRDTRRVNCLIPELTSVDVDHDTQSAPRHRETLIFLTPCLTASVCRNRQPRCNDAQSLSSRVSGSAF